MKKNLETYTGKELVAIAKSHGLEIPTKKDGNLRQKKSAVIEKMIEHGIKVEAKKVEEKNTSKKNAVSKAPVFKRNRPMTIRQKTRRR